MYAARQEIERALRAGRQADALALAAELWRAQPSLATASWLLSLDAQPDMKLPAPRNCRVAILRSFTVEPLVPLLRAEALLRGIRLEVYACPFNEYAQDILQPTSGLYAFQPNLAFLAVQTRDIAPELWDAAAEQSQESFDAVASRVAAFYEGWVAAFRRESRATLVIHSLELPATPSAGILDAQSSRGQAAAIRRVNAELIRIAERTPGVFVLDYDALLSRFGKDQCRDERKWLAMRLPFSASALLPMAREWLRFVCPAVGLAAKVLVTDLDNTLWGGVVGEDGLDNLKIGIEYPGAAFRAVQQTLIDLSRRGILLAIASKNNYADAMRVFEEREGMLLRPEHFSAVRINWNDKAAGLREIAAELNVDTGALAFLDDNPVERARVRSELPEVTVIELPQDPMSYAAVLRDEPVFERLTLSDEDRSRNRYYAEQRQRAELAAGSASIESFYESLEQEVAIEPAARASIARIAQLTQKTNQFNVTTRRYSEQDIEKFASDPDCAVYAARARDRFGDSGIVGVAIVRREGQRAAIDTFLLSCRVIGRGIETAVLAHVLDQCRVAGIREVQGWFRPTPKNAPAAQFYADHGFTAADSDGPATLWRVNLAEAQVRCPAWIRLIAEKQRAEASYAHS